MSPSKERGAAEPQPFPLSYVIGTTIIIAISFAIYDAARGRELQPVGYLIWLILYPFVMIGGRAIYIRRMRRRASRQR